MSEQKKVKLLTVAELAQWLGIGRDLAYKLVKKKDFPSIKLGREYRAIEGDLPDWIERQRKNK